MTQETIDARKTLRALLADFDQVLASEYEALRQRDTDKLEAAVASKQQLVSAITATSRLCPPPPADAASDEDPTSTEDWAQIRKLLSRCALANRTNGAAIDASRSFVTSLLDLICGRRPGERLYDASGRMGDSNRSRAWERV